MSENNDSSRSDRTRDSARESTRRRSSTSTPSTSPTESRADAHPEDGTGASNGRFTQSEWEQLHSDPDVRSDLGYKMTPWETIDTATDSKQVIFMPQDEDLLKDDTFIVAEESSLCDLGKKY